MIMHFQCIENDNVCTEKSSVESKSSAETMTTN